MRKILFGITIVVLLIFTGFVMYRGTNGKLDVWGFETISSQNELIDRKNAQLSTLVSAEYPEALSTLNSSTETLQKTKKEYENQALLLADSKYFKYTEKYKHEFILTKIGNYAKDNKIDIRIVVTNSDVAKLYDINFTLIGKYADVANYIYDIENDSKLGFKIEDFVMVTADNMTIDDHGNTRKIYNQVKANFNCKEISIDLKWLDENESVIPGIITRGNPFINNMTTLTDDYSNETLDTTRKQEGEQITGSEAGTNTTDENTNNTENSNNTTENQTSDNTTGTDTTNTENASTTQNEGEATESTTQSDAGTETTQ